MTVSITWDKGRDILIDCCLTYSEQNSNHIPNKSVINNKPCTCKSKGRREISQRGQFRFSKEKEVIIEIVENFAW